MGEGVRYGLAAPGKGSLWFWLYECLGFFFLSSFGFKLGLTAEGRLCFAQTGPAPLPLPVPVPTPPGCSPTCGQPPVPIPPELG